MPTEWYDDPVEVEQEDEEDEEKLEGDTETEDRFDFSNLMRSTEDDGDYNPGASALCDTATSAPTRRTSRFHEWIPGRFREKK